jgi:hypothetical protein
VSAKRELVHQSVPGNWGKNVTLCSPASARSGAWGLSLVVEGSTNGAVFETYLEEVLCPTLKGGRVVADNLSTHHKGESVKGSIEGWPV